MSLECRAVFRVQNTKPFLYASFSALYIAKPAFMPLFLPKKSPEIYSISLFGPVLPEKSPLGWKKEGKFM